MAQSYNKMALNTNQDEPTNTKKHFQTHFFHIYLGSLFIPEQNYVFYDNNNK